MEWNFVFFLNSVLLGVGLAMDAFSVSIANALNEPEMRIKRMCLIAGCYGVFQFAMPMIGWFCVHTIIGAFSKFQPFIPWIALALLVYIGGKMVWEGFHGEENDQSAAVVKLGFGALIVQGIATSIDALSVGFTIAEYGALMAFVSSMIIAVVTFFICMTGLKIGKVVGAKVSSKATVIGGLILIGIGLEIFIKGVFLS